jgi:hypothetical protein
LITGPIEAARVSGAIGQRRHGAQNNSMAGQHLIQEPSLLAGTPATPLFRSFTSNSYDPYDMDIT